MTQELYFEVDAAIITRLGRELVAKQETALIELVKNSFDADATKVDVVFNTSGPYSSLEIRDDGSGMTQAELVDGFLRLASDMKAQSPHSARYGRQRAGRKGIGRFAAHRLGDRLVLTTCTEGSLKGHKLTVDWTRFAPGRALNAITVNLEEIAPQAPGTTLHIEQLQDTWSDAQIRRCWRGVLALQQPFPVAPVARVPAADPGFSVRFLREGALFRDETLVADFQTEILDHLHAIIELKVEDDGRASWRIAKNRFGSERDWTPIHHEHRDSRNPPRYTHLKNAWMKAYYAIIDPGLLPSLVYSRLRDVLVDEGGVRLYRNGFRVVPYGEPNDDWLQLDESYAKRSTLAPHGNRNFFGVIEIQDSKGERFEEHTSREGLIETPAFFELKMLASSVLITAATYIAEDRGRKARAGRPSPKARAQMGANLDDVSAAVQAASEAAERAAREARTAAAEQAARQAGEAARLVNEKKEEIEAVRAQLADEAAMLRFLATLGMTTAEFSHETGMTFDAFRMDFERVFEVALQAKQNDSRFSAQATRARAMLERLDTLTSYLNSLAAARSVRGIRPVSLSKAVEEFGRGVAAQAARQRIQLEIRTPPYDPLFTRPMHEAELASILLNFYTNSVKAMKRSSAKRRILVVADRLDDSEPRVRVRFSDTGDGVPEEFRQRVFDAFFTTRLAPPGAAKDLEHASGTGLGLWIVEQIAANVGGEASIIEPPAGYSTCFELLLPPEDDNEQ